MLRTALSKLQNLTPFERFSFEHAFSTLIIAALAFTFAHYYPNPEAYWLILTAVLLSQAALRNELSWQAAWQMLFYPVVALIAAVLVFALSLAATYFWLASPLLFITTFLCTYLGWLKRKFFFAAFLINFLGILALYAPCSFPIVLQRVYFILLAGLLVFVLRGLFFLYQRPRRAAYAWVIFLQKLKWLYQSSLRVAPQPLSKHGLEQEENQFQAAWGDCLSALQVFKSLKTLPPKSELHLERIWELTLSLGALRYRINDKALLTMSESELQTIALALGSILDQCAKPAPKASALFDFQDLEKAIQRLEELYQGMLQTVAPEPLVLLLFIQDLRALKEEWGKFVLTSFSSTIPFANKKDEIEISVLKSSDQSSRQPPFFSQSSSFLLRRSFRSAAALFLALLASRYFSQAHSFWLPAIAVLLTQSEMSLPLHQSLQRCLWIVVVLLASMGVMIVLAPGCLPFIGVAVATLTAYSYAYQSRRYLSLQFPLMLMVVILLALLLPVAVIKLPYFFDVLGGALIGLMATLLIFPDKPDLEFPERVVPLMKALSQYLAALMEVLLHEPKEQPAGAVPARVLVEKLWANRDDSFPVWVFEPGFNPALRPGQYYVVVHLGQITEILFALNHLVRHPFEEELLSSLRLPLRECIRRTQELFSNIQLLLEGKKLVLIPSDYSEDICALEESFRSNIQPSIELLDLSRDDVYLAALIRYLKDLRLQLLQVASTLR